MSSSRILVVVDDERARGLLVAMLRADGHAVDAAANRPDALSRLEWPVTPADISRVVARSLAPTPA